MNYQRTIYDRIGQHLGPKTKKSHPGNYDPLVLFNAGIPSTGGTFSHTLVDVDRARFLDDKERTTTVGGDNFRGVTPHDIELFLRRFLRCPHLRLTRVEEHLNAAGGYPTWWFGWTDEKIHKPELRQRFIVPSATSLRIEDYGSAGWAPTQNPS